MKQRFQPVTGPFGFGIDERATSEAFEEYVGGRQRAERLLWIWNNSYPSGTAYDKLMGRGSTKEQVFTVKAKREGFSEQDIDAFLTL